MTTGTGGDKGAAAELLAAPRPGGAIPTSLLLCLVCFQVDTGREGAAFLMVLLAGLECFSLGGGHSRSFIMPYYNVCMRLGDMRSAMPEI